MVGLSIRGKDKAKATPNLVCILKYFVSKRSASPVLSQAKPLLSNGIGRQEHVTFGLRRAKGF